MPFVTNTHKHEKRGGDFAEWTEAGPLQPPTRRYHDASTHALFSEKKKGVTTPRRVLLLPGLSRPLRRHFFRFLPIHGATTPRQPYGLQGPPLFLPRPSHQLSRQAQPTATSALQKWLVCFISHARKAEKQGRHRRPSFALQKRPSRDEETSMFHIAPYHISSYLTLPYHIISIACVCFCCFLSQQSLPLSHTHTSSNITPAQRGR